jgi:glutathione S-transferase
MSPEPRVAIVTGVSRRAGIGFAIAQRLLADGLRVLVHGWAPHDAGQPWGADGTEAVIEKASEEVATLWQRIDNHLKAKGPYLLGDRFSAADIFCHMLSTWQDPCPNTYERFPHVKKLADLVSARPAVAKIIKVNDAG